MAKTVANEPKHRLRLAAAEVVPFAKTGGLADVAGSLPRALAHRGHDCAVILPLYSCAKSGPIPLKRTNLSFMVPIGGRKVTGTLWQAMLPDSSVPAYLVEQAAYFERDDPAQSRGLYQLTLPTGQKADYPDNCERFVFFDRAVLEAIRLLDYWPDVLHTNDWQTGLVPVYLREEYYRRLSPNLRARYARIRTLITIHNIAYQGNFPQHDLDLTGLDRRLFNYHQLEFHGHLSFLKAGIVFSDFVNAVSPMYAREIQTPYFGCGLQGVLSAHADRLAGIVNGVDYRVWDPATDNKIHANYGPDALNPGKPRCKAALQRRYHLPERPGTPLFGLVARLTEQKGIDLIIPAAKSFLHQDTQLVVLGDGDVKYQKLLRELQTCQPDKVGLTLGFDETIAHEVEAGADAFLMPSLYEPSGLNQLYSMKYGTPPIVRATGGLADTVVDANPTTLANNTATGFRFGPYSTEAFQEAVGRAVSLYRTRPDQWRQVMVAGMRQDWSWDGSAAEYER